MALRRGRDDEPAFPIIGKVGQQPLAVVFELCRPGEQPRFVLGQGIYGAWPHHDAGNDELRAAAGRRGWTTI
jgi:hypothetical protein